MSKLVRTAQIAAVLGGLCAVAYGLYVIVAFTSYGHPRRPPQSDALLDRFMPVYDVREERGIEVHAPPETVMEAAQQVSLNDSPLVRAIFKAREIVLRTKPESTQQPRAFVDLVQSIGWRLLARQSGRELIFGAVTQPWKPNVVFRGIDPESFAAFREPGYVKIAWTLRADALGPSSSMFRTETRAVATDADAREKFRRYWATYSPGIILIRIGTLPLVKNEAERKTRR